MCGYCYQWAFDFMLNYMWNKSEANPDQYRLCAGIVQDPQSGKFQDHAWIEDTRTGEILNKYKYKKKVERTAQEIYYKQMRPRKVKKYSGREMLKKVLKTGLPGLRPRIPSK